MQTQASDLIALEQRFWKALVDEDVEAATSMLDEPALMVSPHGAFQFDHNGYKRMAEQGSMVVKSYELSDMNVVFPTEETAVLTYQVQQALSQRGQAEEEVQQMADSSVWTRKDGRWLCVMHTETPLANAAN
ncbi:nuclear transport factor 2 family protein [Alcaligenes phenolicus]